MLLVSDKRALLIGLNIPEDLSEISLCGISLLQQEKAILVELKSSGSSK